MTQSIDVSVVIAAYEAEAFIAGAIQTCLQQSGVTLEVIVVDDCSATSLQSAVSAASGGDPRVRFIRLDKNQGPAGARNAAIDAARGTYIAILDADDKMKPDRLETLVALAEASRADIVADNMIEVYGEGDARTETPFLDIEGFDAPRGINLDIYMESGWHQAYDRPLGYLKPLFRRAFIEAGGYRYDTSLRNSEDHYLVANMLARGASFMFSPYAGYYYVRHEGSISFRITPAQAAAIVEAEQKFLAEHIQTLTPAQKRISARRQSELQKVSEFEAIVASLKDRAPGRLMKLLFSNPRTSLSHLARLLTIAWRKLA